MADVTISDSQQPEKLERVPSSSLNPFQSPLYMQAYDAAGNELGLTLLPVGVNFTGQFFGVDDQPTGPPNAELPEGSQDSPAVTGIASVDIIFTLDDDVGFINNITFDNFSSAPEPATRAMMLIALGGLGAQRIRRRAPRRQLKSRDRKGAISGARR
jgi:hypothetical protein